MNTNQPTLSFSSYYSKNKIEMVLTLNSNVFYKIEMEHLALLYTNIKYDIIIINEKRRRRKNMNEPETK